MGSMSTPRAAVLLLLLSAINALGLAWWLLLCFDPDASISSLSGLRIAAPVVLTVLFPTVGVVAWRFRRRGDAKLTRWVRAYILVSITFLALSWLPAAGMTTLLVWLEEPWPLSLQQGPDTSRARVVFQRNFGVEPSVSNVYARVDGSGTMYIAFSFEDEATVERIVERWSLRRVPPTEGAEVLLAGPSWFPPADALAQMPEKYVNDPARGTMATLMWVDRIRRRVFYMDLG